MLRAIDIEEKTLGPDHHDVAATICNLAMLMEAQVVFVTPPRIHMCIVSRWHDEDKHMITTLVFHGVYGHVPLVFPEKYCSFSPTRVGTTLRREVSFPPKKIRVSTYLVWGPRTPLGTYDRMALN